MVQPRVDAETRRGRDYVRVTLVMTVESTGVAGALTEAWQTFRAASLDDPKGWDLASAGAEIRPQGS